MSHLRTRWQPLVALLCLLTLSPASRAAPAVPGPGPIHWSFVVTLPGPPAEAIAEVDWTLWGLSGPVRIAADMEGSGRFVEDLRQVEAPGEGESGPDRPLVRRGETWSLAGPAKQTVPLHLRYRYRLAQLAASTGDPDYASRVGEDFIVNDQAFLLRPDPLPASAAITVEFRLPPGTSVAVPWKRIAGPGWRFRSDAQQFDAGSYVAIGKLTPLGELPVQDGTVSVTLLGGPHKATSEALLRWVKWAAEAVGAFYGQLPGRRVHVVLAPVPRSDEPGVFGTVLHKRLPSVVLYFGAQARDPDFQSDWVAPHELFHMGNPPLQRRLPWFQEGFTTYYQDILRARAGAQSAAAMWGDMYDGFRRFCNPEDGTSLLAASRRLRQEHRYNRVYWGGACLAFVTDVAIRQRSAGKRSLDDVMRVLWTAGQRRPLTEDQVIEALERAAGSGVVRRHLESTQRVSLDATYRSLGIEPTGKSSVRLHDEAPLAALRRGIF